MCDQSETVYSDQTAQTHMYIGVFVFTYKETTLRDKYYRKTEYTYKQTNKIYFYAHVCTCTNSEELAQPGHVYVRVCLVREKGHYKYISLFLNHQTVFIVSHLCLASHKGTLANSVDPDQTPQMRRLIWVYTVCISYRKKYDVLYKTR